MKLSDIDVRYKRIPGFDDYYITECGEVYSTRLRGNEQEPHLHKLKPKNPGASNKYLNIILCNQTGQHTKSVHRLVAENFVEGYFNGAVVNHIDGNNRNNMASNLEWVTTAENIHKSYITSGKSAKRNYLEWRLFSPDGDLLGVFYNHVDMESYVTNMRLNAAPTQLTKNGKSKGYYIEKMRVYNQKL